MSAKRHSIGAGALFDVFEALTVDLPGERASARAPRKSADAPHSILSPSPPVLLLGVPFDRVTMRDALDRIERMIESREPHYLVTANLDFAAQARQDVELRRIFLEAHLVLCDGTPLVWASRLLGAPVPERVAGSDLVPALIERAAQKQYRLFFLGGMPEVTAQAIARLKTAYPGLVIAGHHSPPFQSLLEMDHDEIARRIRAAQPDIVLVSFGCPKAEKWMAMHYRSLGVPVMIGVGATIDFLAGRVKRAPFWMRRAGLEWLFRLWQEPRRLFRRYASDFCFLTRVLSAQWWRMRAGFRPQGGRGALTSILVESTWQRIAAPGRLDAAALGNDAAAWTRIAEDERDCLLDLGSVTFMDASGLGLLVWLQRRLAGSGNQLVLLDPSPAVWRVLRLMRLQDFFTIARDALEARELVQQRRQQRPAVTVAGDGHVVWQGDITTSNADQVWRLTATQFEQGWSHDLGGWLQSADAAAPARWSAAGERAPRDGQVETRAGGEADLAAALGGHLEIEVRPRTPSELFIDCSEVRFIDSAGAAVVARALRLAQQHGRAVRLIGLNADVANVLHLARVDRGQNGRFGAFPS